jgi:integrase/recombinase XerD
MMTSSSKLPGPPPDGLLGSALEQYFCGYLINQRQLSPRTIASYRDTFKLLLAFLEQARGTKPDNVCVRDLNASNVLQFLGSLESVRRNGARSRNLRLAAIRSFLRYAAASDPLLLPVAQPVLAIPGKRFERPAIQYLSPGQVHALLHAPSASTQTGFRDRVLLALMYNTGARVSEITAFKNGDLQLGCKRQCTSAPPSGRGVDSQT